MKKAVVAVLGAGVTALGVGTSGAVTWEKASHVDVVNTSSGSWVFTPDNVDTAELIQSPARSQLAWEVPGAFSNGAETIHGDLIIRPTGGELQQPDFQFDTPNSDIGSAMYAYGSQTGSGYGVPAYFFSPQGIHGLDFTGSAGKFLTGGDGIHVGPGMSWLLGPADYTSAITGAEALGKVNFAGQGVLDLGHGNNSLIPSWTVGSEGEQGSVMFNNMPIWEWKDASFTGGPDNQTLTGNIFMNTNGLSGYNEEFVTNGGATYDVSQWGFGFTNMYYDPGDHGAAVDILKTPLGDMNMSWASWLFTPPDYASSTSGVDALSSILSNNTGILSDTFQFGQDTLAGAGDVAGAASDVGNYVTDALGSL